MTKNNKNRDLKTANDYAEGILHGDRIVLGRAITLAESRRIEHQALVREILEQCLPCTGNSLRIGITGSPGVGKSSFIETFGSYLTQEQGRRLASWTRPQPSLAEVRQQYGGKQVSDEELILRYLVPAEDLAAARAAGPVKRTYDYHDDMSLKDLLGHLMTLKRARQVYIRRPEGELVMKRN